MSAPHRFIFRTAPGAILSATLLAGAAPAVAQTSDAVPSRLASVELERSRSCVATLAGVEALDDLLDPLAQRSRRLLNIADAISLEDRSITSQLDPSDPLESDV